MARSILDDALELTSDRIQSENKPTTGFRVIS
jgi:hypothetical protein